MANIQLPNNWSARPYQRNIGKYMLSQTEHAKRGCLVWHRRSGKDSTSLNLTSVLSQMRIGTYWHLLPELNQGRKVIWNGIDKYGRRMIDQAFPLEMRAGTNESDMRINFKNGSIWQVVGSDNYNSLVGTNPVGVIMSEYSVADPKAWDFIRPILAENGGWAIFIYTSRGRNHGYYMYEMAKNNPKWFCELLTASDTFDDQGNSIITPEIIQEERDSGMEEDMILQEYYCSFDSGLAGAYYTKHMQDLRSKDRIGDYPWIPDQPVHTFWDIGLRDANAIWFGQSFQGAIRFIDYMEDSNVAMLEWIKRLEALPYTYGVHRGPHDLAVRDYTTGISRIDVAADHGFYFDIAPKFSPRERIDATKRFLPRCQFNEKTCSDGIDSLFNYQRDYNDTLKVYLDRPLHNWASHGADAFGIAATDWPENFSSGGVMAKFKVKKSIGRR